MSSHPVENTAALELQQDRRGFLKKTGLMSLGVLAATSLLNSSNAAAVPHNAVATSTSEDIAILNVALALEHQAIAAYQLGYESGLLSAAVQGVVVKFQSQHKAHASVLTDTIEKLGGKAVVAKNPSEYGFPVASLKRQEDVLRFAAGLEKGAASAYLGAVPAFHNKDLAKAAASILGDETMHWAILLNALGEDPVPVSFIS